MMNIEKQIQNLFAEEHADINPDRFLDRLHSTRDRRVRNQQRLSYSISSFVVVLLVGLLSITQLNDNASDIQYNQYYADADISEEMMEEYYDEISLYLVEQSDDIWSTMEFFYDVNN